MDNKKHIYNISRYLIGVFGLIGSVYYIVHFTLLVLSSIQKRDIFSCVIEIFFTIVFLLLAVGIFRTWEPRKWAIVVQYRQELISYGIKQKCSVDMTKPIYYAILDHQWGRYLPDKVMVLSNESFSVHRVDEGSDNHDYDKSTCYFRDIYDENKQIMIYFTVYSRKNLPISKWIKINDSDDTPLW